MSEKYFVAYLKNGERFIDKKCNQVSYTDPNYVIFKHSFDLNNPYSKYDVLAIIPHSSIKKIIVKEETN